MYIYIYIYIYIYNIIYIYMCVCECDIYISKNRNKVIKINAALVFNLWYKRVVIYLAEFLCRYSYTLDVSTGVTLLCCNIRYLALN